jgi:hypothetical protein
MERVTYRTATAQNEKEAIYRLRYMAYLREAAIAPNLTGMFHDPFDETDNVWIVGMYVDGELASSIRMHVADKERDPFPATTVFGDVVRPLLRRRLILVDPTRFVTRLDFSRRFPEMPYLTVRPGWMTGEYFHADYILATIRNEHQAFYRKVFGHEPWCGAREYPTLKKKVACMGLDYATMRDRVHARYPFYESTIAEREALFGVSSNPQASSKRANVTWEYAG